ncbi:MAG: hypothetical protein EPN25_04630 [Nitrospirae bacterium]|nr:MAG: hypothetical protein EPN25_04630 [Nitrospirota bacterium]
MKPSVTFRLGAGLVMIFALSSMSFAADAAPKAGMKAVAAPKSTGSFKIKTADINFKTLPMPSALFKSEWKQMNDKADIFSDAIPVLEQRLTALNARSEECKNKAYTPVDMTAAGCTEQEPVSSCSSKLFRICISAESGQVLAQSTMMWTNIQDIQRKLNSAVEEFHKWQEKNIFVMPRAGL